MLASTSTLPRPSAPQPDRARAPSTSARIVAKNLPFDFVAVSLPPVTGCMVESSIASRHGDPFWTLRGARTSRGYRPENTKPLGPCFSPVLGGGPSEFARSNSEPVLRRAISCPQAEDKATQFPHCGEAAVLRSPL